MFEPRVRGVVSQWSPSQLIYSTRTISLRPNRKIFTHKTTCVSLKYILLEISGLKYIINIFFFTFNFNGYYINTYMSNI